jgi:ABC-type nitrate/sulfonate/bicarbonate transport system permease component
MRSVFALACRALQHVTPLSLVLGVWTCTALSVHALRGVEMPTPWYTAERLVELLWGSPLAGHTLFYHIQESVIRWSTGISIGASLGICLGLLAGGVPRVAKATSGIPQMLLMIPGLAWIPVAILLFGIGEASTIFMITIAAFAPIAVNVQDGIQDCDLHLVRAARMMGASKTTLFFKVLLPSALPALITGLRIGLGTGWRVLVAAEMVVGTGTGLGYAIIQTRWSLDYTAAFVCIAVICIIGLSVERLFLNVVEKKTIARWSLSRDKS